jgi:RNA polymerase sigma factor (sigma-70 family)
MEAAARLLPRRQQRRDEAAASELEGLRPLGQAYLARRFGGQVPRADAEDAVSEVIIRLHRRIVEGRAPENLRAAFFTSVRNAAIDQFRARQARPTVALEQAEERPSATRPPTELAEAREDADRLHDALARMRTNYREAIMLRYGAGLTVPEIAARQRISLPAAKKLVLRATAQARQRIEALDAHEFCPEMRDAARRSLLDKESAGLATEAERRTLRVHLRHCGSCKAFLASLHHDLHELGGGALLGLAAGDPLTHGHRLFAHLGHWLGHASAIPHAATTRIRLAAYKAGGALPGADTGSAGLAGAGAQKAIALCGAATATAATCLATGVIGPGLGVTAAHPSSSAANPPAAASAEPTAEALPPPVVEYSPAPQTESEPSPPPEPAPSTSQASATTTSQGRGDGTNAKPRPSPSQQASEQFGFESGSGTSASTPPPEPDPAPEPEPEPETKAAPEPSAAAPTSSAASTSSSTSTSSGSGAGSHGGSEHFGFSG